MSCELRAHARRGVDELAGTRFRERDQVFRRFHRKRRMHDEEVRLADALGDRREIAQRIVGQRLVDRRRDRERGQREQQHVAVGRRSRDDLRADHGASAGTRIDDDRLAEALRKRLREHARERVAGAAGRSRDDDAYGTRRVGALRMRDHRAARKRGSEAPREYPVNGQRAVLMDDSKVAAYDDPIRSCQRKGER